MFNNIKAVLFDLDGTLIDSMWMWKDIDIEYLRRFGFEYTEDLQQMIEGMSFTETAIYFKERYSIPDSISQIQKDWNQMAWDKYCNEVPLKEGVLDFLKSLKKQGIKMGIATSNSRELVDLVITKLGIHDYFESVRTSCEVERGKPAPDIYLRVSRDLCVDASHCLVFEDVLAGVMAGKSAGMKVCGVYDPCSKEAKEAIITQADYYIHSYLEVLNMLA